MSPKKTIILSDLNLTTVYLVCHYSMYQVSYHSTLFLSLHLCDNRDPFNQWHISFFCLSLRVDVLLYKYVDHFCIHFGFNLVATNAESHRSTTSSILIGCTVLLLCLSSSINRPSFISHPSRRFGSSYKATSWHVIYILFSRIRCPLVS